ncbi:MAG: large subunit ribosomal protein [Pseudomonadota bacterium]|nr:large subunit ribosomal protein [Pseudomonadota bacterium]
MLSRKAKTPLSIPNGVEVSIDGSNVKVKGSLGQTEFTFNDAVSIIKKDNTIVLETREETKFAKALSGTVRAIVVNMITGVTAGFEKKLTILGVGYRAQLQGTDLNLTLGYSHPVVYKAPAGIKVETPSQTEIVVKGIDKQLVGQAAANIRKFRQVEPYKGKGIRYSDEQVSLKEAKKK